MAILSVKYITPLKIVSLCIVIIGYVLHTVGITAKEWDGIHEKTTYVDFDAYQSLWGSYDSNSASFTYAVYGNNIVKTGIPDWKMTIIIMESSGVGLAFLSSVLIFTATFVTPASRRKTVQQTLSTLAFLMLLASGGESIVGVKMYLEKYLSTIGHNMIMIMQYEAEQGNPGLYKLNWPPYLCISAGGMYILAGIFLIIDTIVTAVSKKPTEVIPIVLNKENKTEATKSAWD